MSVESLWKKYFPFSKLVLLLVALVACGLYMYRHYNLVVGEPRIKQVVMHNVAVIVKQDRLESELIKENNQWVVLPCYTPYCGLMKEGKYILSEIKYIIFHDQKPLSKSSSKNIYYLSHICINKKSCFDNNVTNLLNKKKTQLINDARFGAFYWIVVIILIIVVPYGDELKSKIKKAIERKYGIR